MIDYLDTYTRLCLNAFSDVIVTYYSAGGKKTTKQVELISVEDFEYFAIRVEDNIFSIPFFDKDIMIESIRTINSNKPIYYNSYVNKDLYNGAYIDKENVEKIKEKVLGKKELDSNDKEKIKTIEKHVYQYLKKQDEFEYEDLFFSEKQKKEFEEFFEILKEDIINYCKKNGLDTEMKLISKGTTSLIYQIGDKIIKIGKPRRNVNIPYCEYLLQPIINKDYYFDGYPVHIEVTEKVKALKKINGRTFDPTFGAIINDFYDKLESIGLISHDLHAGNLGILIKENKVHFDTIEFDTADGNVTSIKNNNNLKVRGPGEYIIIDLDCLDVSDEKKYFNYLKSLGFCIEDNNTHNLIK